MKKQWTRISLGLILILAGVGYAGSVLGFWRFDLFFDGWWTLFLIVPCLFSILDKGFEAGNLLGLAIGVMLLLSAQGFVRMQTIIRLSSPLILVCIGLGLVIRPRYNRNLPKLTGQGNMEGAPDICAIFGTENRRITNAITGGANLTAVFGTLTIDLRDAQLTTDIMVQTTAVFGSVNLLLPEGTPVRADGFSLFGSLHNHMSDQGEEGRPAVFVSGVNVFGGTEVKG